MTYDLFTPFLLSLFLALRTLRDFEHGGFREGVGRSGSQCWLCLLHIFRIATGADALMHETQRAAMGRRPQRRVRHEQLIFLNLLKLRAMLFDTPPGSHDANQRLYHMKV